MEEHKDEELSDLIQSFMKRLRAYLDGGGGEDVVDRILAAGSVAAAAAMILWAPARKAGGLWGFIASIFWGHKEEPVAGMPGEQER